MDQAAFGDGARWFEATARQRVLGLLDADSFTEFLDPSERMQSPHLALFGLPRAFDDGVIVGRGALRGRPVLVAAQEGQFMGGTFGEVSGAKIVGLLRAARDSALARAERDSAIARAERDDADLPRIVLLLLDSGGVRLQEANAGELAVAEVMRAIVEARSAAVTVVGVVGGRAGAFGGAGLTAATCSRIVISEQGRIGVTGPEVIETNKGAEEFDSQDKGLVWSTFGGKNRCLIGAADAFARPAIGGFRTAILSVLDTPSPFDLASLRAEQRRLQDRLEVLGACHDAVSMWRALGIEQPREVRDMGDDDFAALLSRIRRTRDDAR